MLKSIVSAAVGIVFGATLMLSFPSDAYSAHRGLVSPGDYAEAGHFLAEPYIEQLFHHSGRTVSTYRSPMSAGMNGNMMRVRVYPASIPGDRVRVTYRRYVTFTSNFGWVLWSKTWCSADGLCTSAVTAYSPAWSLADGGRAVAGP